MILSTKLVQLLSFVNSLSLVCDLTHFVRSSAAFCIKSLANSTNNDFKDSAIRLDSLKKNFVFINIGCIVEVEFMM